MQDAERSRRSILQAMRLEARGGLMTRLSIGHFALGIAAAMMLLSTAAAQDMPDPSLINGRAIPASDLPNGTVTVRVVRESIGNNVPGQQVKVTVGRTFRNATTDAQGRAEFKGLPGG